MASSDKRKSSKAVGKLKIVTDSFNDVKLVGSKISVYHSSINSILDITWSFNNSEFINSNISIYQDINQEIFITIFRQLKWNTDEKIDQINEFHEKWDITPAYKEALIDLVNIYSEENDKLEREVIRLREAGNMFLAEALEKIQIMKNKWDLEWIKEYYQSLNTQISWTCKIYLEIARTNKQFFKIDEAIKVYKQSLKVFEFDSWNEETFQEYANMLIEIVRYWTEVNRIEDIYEIWINWYKFLVEKKFISTKKYIKFYNYIVLIYLKLKDSDKAIEISNKQIKTCKHLYWEEDEDYYSWLDNLANSYQNIWEYDKALDIYYALENEVNTKKYINLYWRILNGLGNVYKGKKLLSVSSVYYDRATQWLFDKSWFDVFWFDKSWFDSEGYNKYWFNKNWIYKITGTEYNEDWYNRFWYNNDWVFRLTWTKFNQEWYNISWFDEYWLDKNGFNSTWFYTNTRCVYDKNGYNKNWFNEEWYDIDWYHLNWYNDIWFNRKWFNEITWTRFNEEWYDIEWKDVQWRYKFWYNDWWTYIWIYIQYAPIYATEEEINKRFDKDWYDLYWYNKNWFNRSWIHEITLKKFDNYWLDRHWKSFDWKYQFWYDENWKYIWNQESYYELDNDYDYHLNGYDKYWFNKRWYNKKWFDRYWYNEGWFNEDWYNRYWYNKNWFDKDWYDGRWFDKKWFDINWNYDDWEEREDDYDIDEEAEEL